MRFILLNIFLVCGFVSLGQEQSYLRIYVSPTPETIVIDDKELKHGYTMPVLPGDHRIQLWKPYYTMLDTVININEVKVYNFNYELEATPAYIAFQQESKRYRRQRIKKMALPAAITATSGAALAYLYVKGNKIYDELTRAQEEYRYAGYNLEESRNNYNELQRSYRAHYYGQFVAYGSLAVSGYFLVKGIKWVKNNPAPELPAVKNPLTLNSVGVAPIPGPGSGVMMGVNISLN